MFKFIARLFGKRQDEPQPTAVLGIMGAPPAGPKVPPPSVKADPAKAARQAVPFVLKGILKIGMTSPNVTELKRALKLMSYNVGEVNDRFDRVLDSAVREFQKQNGLKVDGIVGKVTAALVSSGEGITSNVPNPATPSMPGTPPEDLGAHGAGLKAIPFAVQSVSRMKVRGTYAGGYPWGALVHYTAGGYKRGLMDGLDVILQGIKNGYTYLAITSDGQIVQAHDVDKWGYHAGESNWKGLGSGVSSKLIGIEICNPGILTKKKDGTLETWTGEPVPMNSARFVDEAKWGCPTGWYLPYTEAQEKALERLLLWLKQNDPTGRFSFDYVVGHHEVSGKRGIGRWRKMDPGGALSVPMENFRTRLKTLG